MRAERGFTLAELVIVMVLVGVLATVAIPKLFDTGGFASRGARDFVAGALRDAQRAAIASRRNVCVALAGSTVAITYASASGAGQACNAGNLLAHPANGLSYADPGNALPGGATLAGSASVVFDATGAPASAPGVPLAAALSISVNGHAQAIAIEPESGFVH
ncbi:MAG: pilus assembly FimT family protein [Caldimonas sp.]